MLEEKKIIGHRPDHQKLLFGNTSQNGVRGLPTQQFLTHFSKKLIAEQHGKCKLA